MNVDITQPTMDLLAKQLEGELLYDETIKVLYATDASVYRALPQAVAFPKSESDIIKLVKFANEHKTYLVPRAAGTSLAGQTVGEGIIVDCSKYLNQITEINTQDKWALVQPGVIRNELNYHLSDTGLFFGPITATASRATIGGMVGNNSAGTNSIVYGTTRDKIIEVKGVLSDGSIVTFSAENNNSTQGNDLEAAIRVHLHQSLSDDAFRQTIEDNYPKTSIHRRNTGYALDVLAASDAFNESGAPYNIAKLICGSEGTLMFITEVKIQLDVVPPAHQAVIAVHCATIDESLRATQVAMKHQLYACELMDKIILDCTKENDLQNANRFFVEGDPEAILLLDVRSDKPDDLHRQCAEIIADLKSHSMGYAFPIVHGANTSKVWQLRSAGLGLLANIKGDAKAVACIEDTAVALDDLPEYIADFNKMLDTYGQRSVHYAHAGAGEIHLRPILDLKKSEDRKQFYEISRDTAELVKKYKGSLSGEHGDGRVRAPFIPMMVGEEIYQFYQELKAVWDPNNIFNRGKILDADPMNESLRYDEDQETREIETIFDFKGTDGMLRAVEKCNGSGDCRKLPLSGGTMCPSYQATRNERDSTRARANILREYLTRSTKENVFDHEEIKEVLDLCLSCKGCTSECPSNVNMTMMKAEFQHQYYKDHRRPLRSRVFGHINDLNKIGSIAPWLYNLGVSGSFSSLSKMLIGVHPSRSLPKMDSVSVRKWYQKHYVAPVSAIGRVILFVDEFSNYNETQIGIQTIQLLVALNYKVSVVDHQESGRAAFSKGMLHKAKKHAEHNVEVLGKLVSDEVPLIGIEPSAILSFRDEYPLIVGEHLQSQAQQLKTRTLTIDEFIAREYHAGRIRPEQFEDKTAHIKLHGHCHQKALCDIADTITMLSIPDGHHVELIPSGCCGMAGSFGYEKEHFEVSKQVADLVLLPALRSAEPDHLICAPGTSCRHQIKDLADIIGYHPVELLFKALKS